MPLDDREQRILAEIERQFYEEEPELALAVKNIERPGQMGVRIPIAGVLVGLITVIMTFTVNSFVALIGFILMVVSATALVHVLRRTGWAAKGNSPGRGQRLRRFRRD